MLREAGITASALPDNAPMIVMSVKFSLSAQASPGATNLYKVLHVEGSGCASGRDFRDKEGLRRLVVPGTRSPRPYSDTHAIYFPNAYNKGFCGVVFGKDGSEDWSKVTNKRAACMGKCGVTCYRRNAGRPCCGHNSKSGNMDHACWQFAFRRKLEQAKRTGGIMLQLIENGVLGDGQKIERAMAHELRVPVFEVYWRKDQHGKDSDGQWDNDIADGSSLLRVDAHEAAFQLESIRLQLTLGLGPWR